MIKLAVPNKGALSEAAAGILQEAGYKPRRDKALSVYDEANGVEFYFLRPKDIAIYVANGKLDLGITGRDLSGDSQAQVDEVMALGFGTSTFRYAAPKDEEWTVEQLNGKRIATSYPNLVRADMEARGYTAQVIRLDGAVEISIKLGVADVIADVVSTGNTLRQQGLKPFGDPIISSEAVIIKSQDKELNDEHEVLLSRIRGILTAHTYLMLDYNVAESQLERASEITPGLSGPTVMRLHIPDWVAVRALVPKKQANQVMDKLARLGAEAILASELRIARI